MKIKTTILFTSFLAVGAFLGYYPNTITANNINTNTHIQLKKSYDTTVTAYCPVVGTGNAVEKISELYQANDDNAPIYKHCSKCLTGAYLLHKEENLISRCSFCGALEDNSQNISISGE